MLTCSALLGQGIAEVWAAVGEFREAVAGELAARRADQARQWMWSEVTDALLDELRGDRPGGAGSPSWLESRRGAGRRHAAPQRPSSC